MKAGFIEIALKTYEYLQGFLDLALTRFLVSTQYEKCRKRRDRKENQEMETQTVEKKIQGRCNSP